MPFSALTEYLEKMEETTKRLELTAHLVGLFGITPADVVQSVVYLLQGKVRPDFEGIETGVAEKMVIRAIAKSSGRSLSVIESEYVQSGDLGLTASRILSNKIQTTFMTDEITVERVYDTMYRIAHITGSSSKNMKINYVSSLLNDATPDEARFITKILLNTMRLGVADNTIMDGLAEAYTGDRSNRPALEAAYSMSSDLGRVAHTVAQRGLEGLESFDVQIFSPVRPMLAERVRSESDAVSKMESGAAEYKLDGERTQIHIDGDRVEIFSRRLERITNHYPDIVSAIPAFVRSSKVILEAETVVVNKDTGELLPFQYLMHRRRKHGIEQAVGEYPVLVYFFDVLYEDGRSCLNVAYGERRHLLESLIHEHGMARIIPSLMITDEAALADFMESSISAGGEGLMLKSLTSPYRAGSRGSQWLKLKREYKEGIGDSLDLVVIGAFYGRGRRTGMYGALLLGVYDEDKDQFASVCKVGTGFTDKDLDTLYQRLSDKIIPRRDIRVNSGMDADVWFDPDLVIEVVCSEITVSPTHIAAHGMVRKDAGLALRFPKFTGRIRDDKSPTNASTPQEVVALYLGQTKTA